VEAPRHKRNHTRKCSNWPFRAPVPQRSERADRTWSEGLRCLSSGGRDITGTLHRNGAGQPSQEVRNWPISIDADAKRLPTCRGPEAQERQGAPGPPVVGSPRTVSPAIANGDSGPRTPDRCIGVPLHPAARATRTTRGARETRAGAPGRRLGLARLRCPSRRGPGSRERRRQGRVPPCRSGGRASGRDRRVGR
jgi:hypothetical protein